MRFRTDKQARRAGFGMIDLLIIIGVIAFLIALLVPAVQRVREAATRTQSSNNLKQIGIAFHNYAGTYNGKLPRNGGDNANTKFKATAEAGNAQSGSWGFQILPYIEENPAFNDADRTRPIATFMCPGRGRPMLETSNGGGAWTDYFYNIYITTDPQKPDALPRYKIGNIPDGTSQTIMMGHANIATTQYKSDKDVTLSTNIFKGGTTGTMRGGVFGKGEHKNGTVTIARDSDKAPTVGSWGGPFPNGFLVALYDASVRTVSYNYDTDTFRNYLIPDDGNALPGLDGDGRPEKK
jgi:type II secretory pathway pseudopilin PulG